MATQVVNIRREPYDVDIGRAGRGEDGSFGTPFPLRREADRPAVLARYRQYFFDRLANDPDFRRRVEALRGQRLGCFCAPRPCHGDVIARSLDGLPAASRAPA